MNNINLATISIDDAEALFQIWHDKEMIIYTYHPYIDTIEECRNRINGIVNYQKENNHYGPLTITYGGKIIGLVGLELKSEEAKEYELWYILSKFYWGKGIGSEVVRLFVDRVFSELDIERLYAEVVTENVASYKVLEKNRFVKEGYLRREFSRDGSIKDLYVHSILREEWER